MKTYTTILAILCVIAGCGTSLDYPQRLNPNTTSGGEGAAATSTSGATSSSQNSASEQANSSTSSSDTSTSEEAADGVEEAVLNYLIINEIYYDAPDADTNGDIFIELLGEVGVDLAGVKILLVNGDDGKIYQTIEIPADSMPSENGLFTVADAITGNDSQSNVSISNFIVNFDPQNGPDAILLVKADGSLLDAICYGKPKVTLSENNLAVCEGSSAVDVSGGKSLSRVGGADSGDNAVDFVENASPTPGVL